ncbi:MAG: TIGR01212 family radical SAM protein [Pirellulales bacterium]
MVGIVIGTRPDCVPNEVLDYIQELAETTYVCLEYGMQTMHDASLDWMNRGHHHDAMLDAMERSRNRGFDITAHLILGLPGETHDMMIASAKEVIRLGVHGVKIHNLYAVERTKLADQVRSGEVQLMDRDTYVSLAVDVLELMPDTMVIERLSGEAPSGFFVGPDWALDKPGLQIAIKNEIDRRQTYQSKRFSA